MKIQLALDRVSIAEAVCLASAASPYVDWVEVGTSLVKEFGMASVAELRRALPEHVIVADMKTFDNAIYEMELCFRAGANVATVMAAAPKATITACKTVADRYQGHIMIDLLAADATKREHLSDVPGVTWCHHVSKDEQELRGESARDVSFFDRPTGIQVAVAGGVSLDMIPNLKAAGIDVVIIGSAITKAVDPATAARAFYDEIHRQSK